MLENADWQAINGAINRAIAQNSSPQFAQGEVVRNDEVNNLVWLEEFGNQPIPMYAFEYEVKYYDIEPHPITVVTTGQVAPRQTLVKKAVVKVLCPKVGDVVLVAKQFGERRLPKCLGVLQSKNFVIPSE